MWRLGKRCRKLGKRCEKLGKRCKNASKKGMKSSTKSAKRSVSGVNSVKGEKMQPSEPKIPFKCRFFAKKLHEFNVQNPRIYKSNKFPMALGKKAIKKHAIFWQRAIDIYLFTMI